MSKWPSGLQLDVTKRELLVPEIEGELIHLSEEELSGAKMKRISVPEGVGAADFRNVVAVVWMEYSSTGRLLTQAGDIAEVVRLAPEYVALILRKPEYIAALEARGVPVARDMTGLNEKQVLALQVLLDPTDGLTLQKKLKRVGVSMTTYRTWLRNPNFRRHMDTVANNLINDHLPDMFVQLVGKATEGDLPSMKYALEVSGRYNPTLEARRQDNIDIVVLLSKMTEVIQKHVQDPETLEKISRDFRQLAEGTSVHREIEG